MNSDDREVLAKCRDYAVEHNISINEMARAVSHAISPLRQDPPTPAQAKLVSELEVSISNDFKISIRRQLAEALATGRLNRRDIKIGITDPRQASSGKRRAA